MIIDYWTWIHTKYTLTFEIYLKGFRFAIFEARYAKIGQILYPSDLRAANASCSDALDVCRASAMTSNKGLTPEESESRYHQSALSQQMHFAQHTALFQTSSKQESKTTKNIQIYLLKKKKLINQGT